MGQRDKMTKKQRDKWTKGQRDKEKKGTKGHRDKMTKGPKITKKIVGRGWELGSLGTLELGNL